MNWITIFWSGTAFASLAIAGVYLVIWLQQRQQLAYLMFVFLASSIAGVAATELWMMNSQTIAGFGTALRWFHVPVLLAFLSLFGLVHYRLGSERPWLGWAACGLRGISLIINFVQEPNINYREITHLEHISVLGESISIVDGVPNPWMVIGQVSLLMLGVFLIDAAVTAWRHEKDWRTLSVSSGLAVLVIGGTIQALLGLWEIIQIPMIVTPFFLGIAAVMGIELSLGVVRAARVDRQLLASEQRLGLAAEAADAGLWSLDGRSGRIWATRKARDLFSQDPVGELRWENLLERIHPGDQLRMQRLIEQSLQGGEKIQTDFRIVSADGSPRWLTTLGRCRIGGEPDSGVLTGVTMDITAYRSMEEGIARQRAQLAHLSRVATLNELSTSLAHEISQPLGIILSNAEAAQLLLEQNPPDQEQVQQILTDIISADQRAASVISRLRALLRHGDPSREDLILNKVIRETLDLLHNEIVDQGVITELDLDQNLPSVQADRILITQVFLNLFTNAFDAMMEKPQGQGRLAIASGTDGETVWAAVRDNGCGLAEDPERVFEAFFTSKPSGLGVGLGIARSIIEAHGGRIWVEPGPGEGATFRLSLPRTGAEV
jgi:signal transduction histidine kinase